MKWIIEISGSSPMLTSLATSNLYRDIVFISDGHDDLEHCYSFASPHLEDLVDIEDVLQRAHDLKTLFNGAGVISRDLAGPMKFSRWQNTESGEQSSHLIDRIWSNNAFSYSSAPAPSTDKNDMLRWIAVSRSNEYARNILAKIGSSVLDWATLYYVVETIGHAGWSEKSIIEEGNVAIKETFNEYGESYRLSDTRDLYEAASLRDINFNWKDRLNATANKPELSGISGRHGFKTVVTINSSLEKRRMEIKLAQIYVMELARAYLNTL